VISSSQRHLPDNTKHYIHVLRGILIHSFNRRGAAHLRLDRTATENADIVKQILHVANPLRSASRFSAPLGLATMNICEHAKSPRHLHDNFSASLTNLAGLLLQSRDSGCYLNRRILASPLLCLHKHTDLDAQDFTHSTDLCHQP
jgi:hypothetical protein